MIAAAALLCGCKKDPSSQDTGLPLSANFTITPEAVYVGEAVSLDAEVTGGTTPSLDQYLDQVAKARTTLVLELKVQLNEERENLMVDKAIESRAVQVRNSILDNWSDFVTIYKGTGAQYTTLSRVRISFDLAP